MLISMLELFSFSVIEIMTEKQLLLEVNLSFPVIVNKINIKINDIISHTLINSEYKTVKVN